MLIDGKVRHAAQSMSDRNLADAFQQKPGFQAAARMSGHARSS
jgi:hypothetical protein